MPERGIHREGADFGQVLPHDVQCAAADDLSVLVAFRDPELLDVLVKGHRRFVEQDAVAHVGVERAGARRGTSLVLARRTVTAFADIERA